MAGLKLQAVTKSWDGKTQVIQPLTLDVADGEFIVMVGPSGCGKSTLLRMVAGLERVTSGDIWIDRKRVTEMEPKDRGIAMVFQNYALYPHMTVAENMAFALKLKKARPEEILQKVRPAAEILGLSKLLDRLPRHLSGGQRQRVAMGRAIVRNPAVFLFDEPLSNLDAKLRVQMRTEIKALHQRLRTTMIYVTHDQIEAMTMADRIVVMQDGRVEQIGAPLELYDRPANIFVASFIGSPAMNLLPGTTVEGGVQLGDGMVLPLPVGSPVAPGRRVTYGVRPEHLLVGEGGLPMVVEVMEPTGSETQVFGRLGEHRFMGSFRERIQAAPGEVLPIHWDTRLAHLFDQGDGLRLETFRQDLAA